MNIYRRLLYIWNLFLVCNALHWVTGCGGVRLNNPDNINNLSGSATELTALTVGAFASNQNALLATGLNNPTQAYSDGTHLFVADTNNNRVLIYNQIPTTSLVVPDLVLGQPNLSTNTLLDGVTESTLNAPQGLCVAEGKLFVADTGNNRVLVWNSIPTTNAQAANLVLGQTDLFSNTASVSQTPLFKPFNLVCNSKYLWVLDTGGHVSTFTLSGLTTNALANPILTPVGTPTALALDSAHLLVGTPIDVQIWNAATATTAPTSSANATLTVTVGMKGLYSDGTHIWFSDSNNRVLNYTGYSTASITIGTNTGLTIGEATPTATTGGTSGTLIKGPRGVFGDGVNLYIADAGNHRILIYPMPTVPGVPTAYATPAIAALGQGSLTLGAANSPIGPQLLYTPNQGFTDGTHLIVADTGNNRVLIWTSIPTTSGASADIVLGQAGNFYTRGTGTDASSGSNAYLSSPRSVFSDGTHLFVADSSNNRVLVWTTFPTSSTTAPNFVIGQSNLTTVSTGISGIKMNTPSAVFSDSLNLYVSDTGNKRLLIYPLTSTLTAATHGQTATYALGANDLVTSGLGLGQYGFTPQGIYADGTRLFVADAANNRVLGWNSIPNAHLVAANLVLGQAGFYSNGPNYNSDGSSGPGPQTCSSPSWPTVISNKFYLSDSSNERILIWNSIPTSKAQMADSVLGQNSLFSSNLNTVFLSPITYNTPVGLSSQGNSLVITDRDNNRILFAPQ